MLSRKKGQIPVKMTFYFDTEDKMRIYSVGPLTYDGLTGYYSLNKNILEYKVRLQSLRSSNRYRNVYLGHKEEGQRRLWSGILLLKGLI